MFCLTGRSAFGAQSTRPSSEGHASVPEADETTREQAKDEVRRGEVTVSVKPTACSAILIVSTANASPSTGCY